MLSAKSVLHVFANPEQYHFKPGVWYAINRPDGLAAIDGQHTVHCRLGLCKEEYDALLAELGLRGQQDTTWQSKIASQANAPRTFMDKASFDTVPSRARTVNRATARVRFGAVTLSQSRNSLPGPMRGGGRLAPNARSGGHLLTPVTTHPETHPGATAPR